MSEESSTLVSLDSFIERELPTKLPELRRKGIVRLRGEVMFTETIPLRGFKLVELGEVDKMLAFGGRLAIPPIGEIIDTICTEGAAWYFTKWWCKVNVTKYRLRSDPILENMVLEVLAGSPDERICADDLHIPEIIDRIKQSGRDWKHPFAIGAALAALGKKGVIRPTGNTVRSRRATCHNRPNLQVWTWAQL
ncbi:MAG: hypothetical protein WCC94_03610 [Candidatus Bathyarchaeia archaeon]